MTCLDSGANLRTVTTALCNLVQVKYTRTELVLWKILILRQMWIKYSGIQMMLWCRRIIRSSPRTLMLMRRNWVTINGTRMSSPTIFRTQRGIRKRWISILRWRKDLGRMRICQVMWQILGVRMRRKQWNHLRLSNSWWREMLSIDTWISSD